MIWNTETKQLEFEDGTPVGGRALNDARVARGMLARKAHLQETEGAVERRKTEAEQGAKRMVRKRDRKNLFQSTQNNLCKRPHATPAQIAFRSFDGSGYGYTSGFRTLPWIYADN